MALRSDCGPKTHRPGPQQSSTKREAQILSSAARLRASVLVSVLAAVALSIGAASAQQAHFASAAGRPEAKWPLVDGWGEGEDALYDDGAWGAAGRSLQQQHEHSHGEHGLQTPFKFCRDMLAKVAPQELHQLRESLQQYHTAFARSIFHRVRAAGGKGGAG